MTSEGGQKTAGLGGAAERQGPDAAQGRLGLRGVRQRANFAQADATTSATDDAPSYPSQRSSQRRRGPRHHRRSTALHTLSLGAAAGLGNVSAAVVAPTRVTRGTPARPSPARAAASSVARRPSPRVELAQ